LESERGGAIVAPRYEELRRLEVAKLAHEKPGQTLQATALHVELASRGDRAWGLCISRSNLFDLLGFGAGNRAAEF
jgi:hypothetical protein